MKRNQFMTNNLTCYYMTNGYQKHGIPNRAFGLSVQIYYHMEAKGTV